MKYFCANSFSFFFVSCTASAVDVAIFLFLVSWNFSSILANVAAYSMGIVVSFSLNQSYTFRGRQGHFGRFIVTNICGLALSTLTVWVLSPFLPRILAKFASYPVTFIWNYNVDARWAFTRFSRGR